MCRCIHAQTHIFIYHMYICARMCFLHACIFIFTSVCMSLCVCEQWSPLWYGVASINRLLKIIGLFCKRAL